MRRYFLPLLTAAYLSVPDANAQGGVRIIFWDYEFYGGEVLPGYGLGYDHDLNDRLSLGIQARFSGPTLQLDYRSAYHFADNDRGSFYMGPQIGLRSFVEEEAIVLPLGFRAGVRGGLRGFYADLFAGVSYAIGEQASVVLDRSVNDDPSIPSPLTFNLGLHMGIGWDGPDR
ncbi:MAG: hypothetical protein ACO1NQ_14090 [Flavobacteriales bacterium]